MDGKRIAGKAAESVAKVAKQQGGGDKEDVKQKMMATLCGIGQEREDFYPRSVRVVGNRGTVRRVLAKLLQQLSEDAVKGKKDLFSLFVSRFLGLVWPGGRGTASFTQVEDELENIAADADGGCWITVDMDGFLTDFQDRDLLDDLPKKLRACSRKWLTSMGIVECMRKLQEWVRLVERDKKWHEEEKKDAEKYSKKEVPPLDFSGVLNRPDLQILEEWAKSDSENDATAKVDARMAQEVEETGFPFQDVDTDNEDDEEYRDDEQTEASWLDGLTFLVEKYKRMHWLTGELRQLRDIVNDFGYLRSAGLKTLPDMDEDAVSLATLLLGLQDEASVKKFLAGPDAAKTLKQLVDVWEAKLASWREVYWASAAEDYEAAVKAEEGLESLLV